MVRFITLLAALLFLLAIVIEYVPANIFWGVLTVSIVGAIVGTALVNDHVGNPTSGIPSLISLGVGFVILKFILGWSFLAIALGGGAVLVAALFVVILLAGG